MTVDALGELAAVDDAELLWDTADPFSPPAWIDGRAVIGQWATVGSDGDVEWLDGDWQGPRDAFGAPHTPPRGSAIAASWSSPA